MRRLVFTSFAGFGKSLKSSKYFLKKYDNIRLLKKDGQRYGEKYEMSREKYEIMASWLRAQVVISS